jgi:hypothetical protein
MLQADQEALAFGVLRHGTDMGHVGVFLRLESEGPRPSWRRIPARGKALAGQIVGIDHEGKPSQPLILAAQLLDLIGVSLEIELAGTP